MYLISWPERNKTACVLLDHGQKKKKMYSLIHNANVVVWTVFRSLFTTNCYTISLNDYVFFFCFVGDQLTFIFKLMNGSAPSGVGLEINDKYISCFNKKKIKIYTNIGSPAPLGFNVLKVIIIKKINKKRKRAL